MNPKKEVVRTAGRTQETLLSNPNITQTPPREQEPFCTAEKINPAPPVYRLVEKPYPLPESASKGHIALSRSHKRFKAHLWRRREIILPTPQKGKIELLTALQRQIAQTATVAGADVARNAPATRTEHARTRTANEPPARQKATEQSIRAHRERNV